MVDNEYSIDEEAKLLENATEKEAFAKALGPIGKEVASPPALTGHESRSTRNNVYVMEYRCLWD